MRLAKRDYVNCADAGYAGCSAGACVAKMPSGLVVTPTPSPAAESRAWCKPVAALSAAAPGEIVGARADGSTYALTDYCSDGRTLAHYSCSGVFYRVELRKCAGAGVCAAGACAAQAAVEVPGADSGYGAWMFYGVVGVFLVACGIALWVYLSGEKARLAKAEKRRGGRGGARW